MKFFIWRELQSLIVGERYPEILLRKNQDMDHRTKMQMWWFLRELILLFSQDKFGKDIGWLVNAKVITE